MATATAKTTEKATATKTTAAKARAEVDFFEETSAKVENLTKTKALTEAVKCSNNIDDNSYVLGGLLTRIHENNWFDDYESFGDYVRETFGFQERKARYLMEIYNELTFNRIPWSKVKVIGWTKLKIICRELSVDNVDEWVEKAGTLSVRELEAAMKANKGGDSDDKNTATESNTKKMSFTLHPDQIDLTNSALAKAKADIGTDYDNVALEEICRSYLQGGSAGLDLAAVFTSMSIEEVLSKVEEAYPNADITVAL